MNNQEARGILANLEADYRDLDPLVLTNDSTQIVNKIIEALGVAISALQTQELSKNSTELDKENGDLQPTCNHLATDTISRQDAIDALKNRWKKTRNYEGNGDDIAEECELYLKQVPSAQPSAQPDVPDTNVGDLISREAMGDALNRMRVGNNETWYSFYQKVLNELCKLPSVQPEDCDTCKHGYFGDGKCDNCRVRFPSHYERRADEGN